MLVGETYVLDLDSLIPFYGEDADELQLAFNFLFVHCELEAEAMRSVVEGMEEKLPAASWPVYTGSNHDAAGSPPAGPATTCGGRAPRC